MSKYLEYKNEIQGLRDVFNTVKTIEKIAASNVHFLKQKTKNLKLYTKSLEQIISRILLFYSADDYYFLSPKIQGKKALIIITGNKGLVGGLYHDLVNSLLIEQKKYQLFLSIGNKGQRYFEEEDINIHKSFFNISKIPQAEEIAYITDYIFSEFKRGEIKEMSILHSRFISTSHQEPTIIKFLPFEFNRDKFVQEKKSLTGGSLGLPIFESSSKKIFEELLKKYIEVFFYKIIIESKLSEISARTIATEHATAKTQENIKNLTMSYLKERRKISTQKQIESFIIHQTI